MNQLQSISEDHGIKVLSPQDQRIYSVGISTGGIAEIRMAKKNPECLVTATTIDPVGAEFAINQIKKEDLLKQIEVKLEDVAKPLPYSDETFDYIYARLILHYLPKIALQSALNELHRVLKQGSKLFVVVRSVDCVEAQGIHSVFDTNTGLTTYSSNGTTLSRYFHSEESIQHYLSLSGFSITNVSSYKEQLCEDFQRLKPSKRLDALIEILAHKEKGPGLHLA